MRRSNLEVYFSRAEALPLIDIGPSNALDERLSCAPENATPRATAAWNIKSSPRRWQSPHAQQAGGLGRKFMHRQPSA